MKQFFDLGWNWSDLLFLEETLQTQKKCQVLNWYNIEILNKLLDAIFCDMLHSLWTYVDHHYSGKMIHAEQFTRKTISYKTLWRSWRKEAISESTRKTRMIWLAFLELDNRRFCFIVFVKSFHFNWSKKSQQCKKTDKTNKTIVQVV